MPHALDPSRPKIGTTKCLTRPDGSACGPIPYLRLNLTHEGKWLLECYLLISPTSAQPHSCLCGNPEKVQFVLQEFEADPEQTLRTYFGWTPYTLGATSNSLTLADLGL